MTKLNKYLLNSTLTRLPLAWFLFTLPAGAITLYHGYAVYFLYSLLIFTVIGTVWVLSGKAIEGLHLPVSIFFYAYFSSCIPHSKALRLKFYN